MSLPAQFIPFGEWLPDQPPTHNPGALEAKNVVPLINGYGALRDIEPFTDALDSRPLNSFWVNDAAGNIHNFAADADKLYKLSTTGDNTWNDVSRSTGYTASDNWEFLRFGRRIIATNGKDRMQYYDLREGDLMESDGFTDLPGDLPDTTPGAADGALVSPLAQHAAVVRDFIVLSGFEDNPSSIRWSGFNSSELWTPSRSTQADIQRLFGRGGAVQRIVPGEYGVVFQEHSIYRMDYASAGITFRIDEVERGRGTPAPYSVCWLGDTIYYYGYDDFYRFNGQVSEPLGVSRIADWAADRIDTASYNTMRGVVDRTNKIVFWSFKTSTQKDANDVLLLYNWGADKWSYAELDTHLIGEFVAPAVGIDTASFNALYGGSIDGANQRSFDDPIYQGNKLSAIAFNRDREMCVFNGAALPATIDTKEITGRGGRHLITNSVRPEVDGVNVDVTVQIGHRDVPFRQPTYTPLRGVNGLGEVNVRNRSRYQRFRVRTESDFNFATGVSVEQREGGKR